jgi:hypothetical protein
LWTLCAAKTGRATTRTLDGVFVTLSIVVKAGKDESNAQDVRDLLAIRHFSLARKIRQFLRNTR